MLLTKTFPPDSYRRALESWEWLDLADKAPVLASLFGDLFLQDKAGYWFLDSLEGTLAAVAATRDQLQAILDTEDGQDRFLLGGFALAAERRGLHLQPSEVYSFRVPPVLGGAMDMESMITRDFVVTLHLAGQLHHELRERASGTDITGFDFQP